MQLWLFAVWLFMQSCAYFNPVDQARQGEHAAISWHHKLNAVEPEVGAVEPEVGAVEPEVEADERGWSSYDSRESVAAKYSV